MTKKENYVYLMYNNAGLYKIGVSCDVNNRRKALQTSSGTLIECVAYYRVKGDAYKVEKQLHELYSKYRTIGEWFAFPDTYTLEKFESKCPKYGMIPMALNLLDEVEEKPTKPVTEVFKLPNFNRSKLTNTNYPEHILNLYKEGDYIAYGRAVREWRTSYS